MARCTEQAYRTFPRAAIPLVSCVRCRRVGPMGSMSQHFKLCGNDPAARFWPKVDKSAGPEACWTWNGAVTSKWGYGCFKLGERVLGAHKVAWVLTNGDPGDLCVLHRCDNRVCVNPAHLFLGTKLENSADALVKDRQSSKLRAADIPEIRQRLKAGEHPDDIAPSYGVKPSTIAYIKQGVTWTHIE